MHQSREHTRADPPMNFSSWHDQRTRDPRRLILGCRDWDRAPAQIEAMLDAARQAQIHMLDATRVERPGERHLGQAVRGDGGWRVVTSLPADVSGEGQDLAELLEAAEASLDSRRSALGVDALPMVLLSRFADRHVCGGRLWRWLLGQRDAGRIGSLGICAATPEQAWAALEDADIHVIQVASGLLDLRLYRQGFFPRSRELGRRVFVRDIDLQGLALREPRSLPLPLSGLAESMRLIRSVATELGIEPRTLYLAFVRELPGVFPVVECASTSQLDEALDDWASDVVEGVHLARLIELLPTLPEELIDAVRASVIDLTRADKTVPNQTPAKSVATIPT